MNNSPYKPLFALCLGLLCLAASISNVAAQAAQVQVLDAQNAPLTTIIDGNRLSLKAILPQPVTVATSVDFFLAGLNPPIATCTLAAAQNTCQTALFPTYGWAWDATGTRQTERTLHAQINGQTIGTSTPLGVTPRPVILVHGFNTNWETTWKTYLGPAGYLAGLGLQGYAVGDGQVAGVMNTGDMAAPLARTNTTAQNAVILGDYIRQVQQVTKAEQVDVVVHSMGGMITRYYLDQVMTERNVAQLIILGTPMGGSACATLPAALGLLLPATLEIQPSYMQGIFNPQITRRRGVPFHAIAGTQLSEAVQSPCTAVPSDLVVSLESIQAISMPVQEINLLHIDLNEAPEVFTEFVRPLLQTPPGDFWQASDPLPMPTPAALQFTRVYTGHVQPGAVQSVTINIDPNVAVASFALYDTSRSLNIVVTGASGKVVTLDPVANGEIRVNDPSTLVYLGYGFNQPKAGQWVVALHTSATTPATGADFALAAQFTGGATLQATLDQLIPQVGEPLTLQARLNLAGQTLTLASAEARVRLPDGRVENYPMQVQGDNAMVVLTPAQSGLHGVEVNVTAQTEAGLGIDRAASLVFEAQPTPAEVTRFRWLAGGLAVLGLLSLSLGAFLLLRRRKAKA